jgi:ABC-type Fe3+ transport system substrate-binding protein
MPKYAQRDPLGKIVGFATHQNRLTDKNPIDQESQEWKDYLSPDTTTEDAISSLERSVTTARLIEANLTEEGKAWLQDVSDQIAALRG